MRAHKTNIIDQQGLVNHATCTQLVEWGVKPWICTEFGPTGVVRLGGARYATPSLPAPAHRDLLSPRNKLVPNG